VKLNGSDGVSLGDASITIDSDAHANVVAGANKAWASGDRTAVSRLGGPATEVEAEIETGGGIPFTFADGMVWGARPDRLWAIDPATDELTRDVALTGLMEILALDVDGDTAWIAARRPGYVGVVRRLDLETGSTSDAAISLPAGVAIAGDGAAWFSSYETNELVGYDAH